MRGSTTSTRGASVTIVAERGGEIVGYGSLHLSNAPWSQHVGEIRVLDRATSMRGHGLGRALTEAVFAQALDRGIEKIVAQMTHRPEGRDRDVRGAGVQGGGAAARPREGPQRREARSAGLFARRRELPSQLDAYGVSEAAGAD